MVWRMAATVFRNEMRLQLASQWGDASAKEVLGPGTDDSAPCCRGTHLACWVLDCPPTDVKEGEKRSSYLGIALVLVP